jgi:polyhydroxyalkanoate synthesis regulator phasin
MFEPFEKLILTGLGAISLSQKMAEDFLKEMKDKYKVSEEEGKAIMDKIQGMAKESKAKIAEAAEEEVKKTIDRLGLVPREEFDRLLKRVEALEASLKEDDPEDE